MLRETSSTSIPPTPPGTRPLSEAALLLPVSTAATTSAIRRTPSATRSSSVRRTAGAIVAVVAIGIVGPRAALRSLRSVPIRPLRDDLAHVDRERLRQRRQRRRLGPGQLFGDESELGLAAARELVREQLERLALLRRLGRSPLDEDDRALERAEHAEAQLARQDEADQREQPEREQQPGCDEQHEPQRVRRGPVRHGERIGRRTPARLLEGIGAVEILRGRPRTDRRPLPR